MALQKGGREKTETDGKEGKERTSNKGQWRPLDARERQFMLCKWPRGCLLLLAPPEAALAKEKRSIQNEPEEAPGKSCPTGFPQTVER